MSNGCCFPPKFANSGALVDCDPEVLWAELKQILILHFKAGCSQGYPPGG